MVDYKKVIGLVTPCVVQKLLIILLFFSVVGGSANIQLVLKGRFSKGS